VAGTPEEVCSYYQTLVKAGVRYFIVGLFGNDRETARLLARWVMPHLTASQARKEEDRPQEQAIMAELLQA
jgi:hypothetical protein